MNRILQKGILSGINLCWIQSFLFLTSAKISKNLKKRTEEQVGYLLGDPFNMHGWHNRKITSGLKVVCLTEVSRRALRKKRAVDLIRKIYVGVQNIIKPGTFSIQEHRKRKAEDVSPQIRTSFPICVCGGVCANSAVFDSLSLTQSICTIRVIKGKEEKNIIFVYVSVVFFSATQQTSH